MARNKSEHNCIFSPTKIIVLSSLPWKSHSWIKKRKRKENTRKEIPKSTDLQQEEKEGEYKEIKKIPKSNTVAKKKKKNHPLFLRSACAKKKSKDDKDPTVITSCWRPDRAKQQRWRHHEKTAVLIDDGSGGSGCFTRPPLAGPGSGHHGKPRDCRPAGDSPRLAATLVAARTPMSLGLGLFTVHHDQWLTRWGGEVKDPYPFTQGYNGKLIFCK